MDVPVPLEARTESENSREITSNTDIVLGESMMFLMAFQNV